VLVYKSTIYRSFVYYTHIVYGETDRTIAPCFRAKRRDYRQAISQY